MAEHINQRRDKSSGISSWLHGTLVIGLISVFIAVFIKSSQSSSSPELDKYIPGTDSGIRPQVRKLSPRNKQVEQYVREKVDSEEYQREIINKLSAIIRIPSESYDDLGPIGEDDR